ncbi:MAG: TonB-dependent receptor [Candidatus Eisenbacteria bacterium]|nr:TonB-dependent receptor [Candidatus Eisenbacteria bacterium]
MVSESKVAAALPESARGVLRGRLTKVDSGEPLAFAYVTLTPADGSGPKRVLTTNAEGFWSAEVRAGRWNVLVEHLLWPAKTLEGVEVNPGEAVALELTLTDQTLKEFRGHVVDGLSTLENISQASVAFAPMPVDPTVRPYGVVTGADGRFSIKLPTGTYEVTVLALNYARRVISRVSVSSGFNTALRVEMLPEAKVTVQEVNVRGNRIRNSAVSELSTRRQSAAVTDGISRESIKKGTDSDAAQVLGRVTGVSVKDGKFLVIRGMSERYASTQVNGVRVGSPEANRKVVPMDIFPASLLDNVVLQKTWTPDLQGDFGGASVQISTRDVPENPVLTSSIGTGWRSGTTGTDGLGYAGGNLDFLGMDDGARSFPDLVADMAGNKRIVQRSPLKPDGPGFSKDDFLTLARSFNPTWSVQDSRPPVNSSWNMALGQRTTVMDKPFGFVGALAYQNGYNTDVGKVLNYEDNTLSTIKGDYEVTRTTQSVLLGGIGNLSLRLGEQSSLKLNTLYTSSSDDEARRYEGYYLDANATFRVDRLLFQERALFSGTLSGEHHMPFLGSRLDWKLNRSMAHRDEPDRRESFYARTTNQIVEEGENGSTVRDTTYWAFSGRGADRLFGFLDDTEKGAELNLTIPFYSYAEGEARFRTGLWVSDKERNSWTRRFTYRPLSGLDLGEPVDSVLANSNIGHGLEFKENTRNTDYTWGDQSISAWYFMFDFPLLKRLRAVAGGRMENAWQGIEYYAKDAFTNEFAGNQHHDRDFLPGINLTWAPAGRQNVRASWSRTLNRPDLRELSPTEITDYESGAPFIGNPALRRAEIDSYDLRWELFPSLSELVSVGGFYKKLTDAIENNIQGGESPRKQPVNTPEGRNYGLELEGRLGLGHLWGGLNRFSVSGNLIIVDSRVEFTGSDGVQTSRVRPLTDQSRLVQNLALFYTSRSSRTEASFFFNKFGRRLTDVGVYGQPDVYEEGRVTLDASLSQRLGRALKLKIVGKNITNTPQRKTQGGKVREDFTTGSSFGISLGFGD